MSFYNKPKGSRKAFFIYKYKSLDKLTLLVYWEGDIIGAKGLTKEIIIEEAIKYIDETQQGEISLHELARRLSIKTPSLYNHIKNTRELQYDVFKKAIEKFVNNQKKAIDNKHKDEAIKAFAKAYFSFAKNNKGLYKLIMSMPFKEDDVEKEMAVPLLNTVEDILSEYALSKENIAHWQRVFRAILHGFISQEYLGYFYYYKDVELEKSQAIVVQCFLNGLHSTLDISK